MWTIASCFVAAIVSALLPWVNAELMLLAVASRLTSVADLSFVVLAVTAGQVGGKSALYWIARRTFASAPNGRLGAAVDRWRAACETRQRSTETMMTLSAICGLPPFYVSTVAAGALRVNFVQFLVAAISGRLLHFSAVALAPLALHAWIR
jgi:membrane protein YqaA with SNARE-associated domain